MVSCNPSPCSGENLGSCNGCCDLVEFKERLLGHSRACNGRTESRPVLQALTHPMQANDDWGISCKLRGVLPFQQDAHSIWHADLLLTVVGRNCRIEFGEAGLGCIVETRGRGYPGKQFLTGDSNVWQVAKHSIHMFAFYMAALVESSHAFDHASGALQNAGNFAIYCTIYIYATHANQLCRLYIVYNAGWRGWRVLRTVTDPRTNRTNRSECAELKATKC